MQANQPQSDLPEFHVELRGVGKAFGGTPVLKDISLAIRRGSVHALVGENGAGKSTLSKIISGIYTPDSGEVVVDGEIVHLRRTRDALKIGIVTIAQELALVPSLTVAQNVFLGNEPTKAGFTNSRALRKAFNELTRDVGFELNPDDVAGTLRTADQQKVEILRALASGSSFIIMDEPTAALSGKDVTRLHDLIRSLAASGRTVLLISHFLSEVLELADDITILRDGELIRTSPAKKETEASLISGMLGRELSSLFPKKSAEPKESLPPVLSVRGMIAPGVNRVSLDIRPGEVVGLAGLVGAGRSEIAHAIFGSTKRISGTVTVDGEAVSPGVRSSLGRGIFMIPESRKDQALFLQRSIRENVTMSNLSRFARALWIRRKQEQASVGTILDQVTVRGNDTRLVSALSGGNQQKVVFGRALQAPRRIMIADEPTRGVDVGSRRAIYDLIVEQANAGTGVLVISSDVEEVIGLCHRVLVVRAGSIVAQFTGDDMTETNIIGAAFTQAIPTIPSAGGK
jgi:simple sugar transport system ATP-binding protein/ribose transport system ATP-binding protein